MTERPVDKFSNSIIEKHAFLHYLNTGVIYECFSLCWSHSNNSL